MRECSRSTIGLVARFPDRRARPVSRCRSAAPAHRTRPAQPKPALRNTLHVVKPNGRSLDPEVARGVPEVGRLLRCAFVFVDEVAEDLTAVALPRCGWRFRHALTR